MDLKIQPSKPHTVAALGIPEDGTPGTINLGHALKTLIRYEHPQREGVRTALHWCNHNLLTRLQQPERRKI